VRGVDGIPALKEAYPGARILMLNLWIAMPLIVFSTLLVMKLAAVGPMKENIAKQCAIYGNKLTWSLTLLYIVTFGPFIGFSMALLVGQVLVESVELDTTDSPLVQ
jgi:NNP family nitrate/nitrite transporter-like MFS transporter